ncbi:MAG TPA: deoxyguanosinetriphosphate triphosphohydrolase [Bacillota bacterium]|nr:deoxyguanosinetriphosphate triphosphohydrolase [Bacillota bacterium]
MIREATERLEREHLSTFATLSSKSRGRMKHSEPCNIRTNFQRDRDKILHCKPFRRLKYKTQVFISPEGDHYRDRLTHTLEVSQIARTISRALRLNEDLTEAIALGHDLGHTPFGHTGERLLDSISADGFKHNVQSLRVVDLLENGRGLNLTWEVRDGILHHNKSGTPGTLEGRVVSISDRIAYINHDIDDALRAKIITGGDLPKDCIDILGDSHKKRINTMVNDIVTNSATNSVNGESISMSLAIRQATDALREFMFNRVYIDSKAKTEDDKAMYVLEALFKYYLKNLEKIPSEYLGHIEEYGTQQVVCDFIAGMTDRYAIRMFRELFIPTAWKPT